MNFADHFSRLAQQYARYRPQYPPELYAYLASVAPGRSLAWDCGTGSGQAAHSLAGYFEQVVATDASAEQVAQAAAHPRVTFLVEPAEQVTLPDHSVDLIACALAVHWFDLERFYAEVRRVARPGGVLAVWGYHLPQITPEVDRVLLDYYGRVLAGYWPQGFHYVHERYRTLPFPFAELAPPPLAMRTDWDLDHVAGFLASWSASQRYLDQHGQHPLEIVWDDLARAWGEAEQPRPMSWPLYLRVGTVG